jgi:hypothetical protein
MDAAGERLLYDESRRNVHQIVGIIIYINVVSHIYRLKNRHTG